MSSRPAPARNALLQHLEFVLRSIPDYAAFVDCDLIYRYCNESYALATGLEREEIIGAPAESILGTKAIEKIRPHLDRVLAGERVHYEEWVKYKFDDERYVDVIYEPQIIDGEVLGFAVLVRNITSRKRAEDQLNHQVNHDLLTGLPNRKFFSESAERMIARARRNGTLAALLFLDLDRFKQVNDAFGHEVGDKVLKAVVTRWSSVVRSNELLARLGGDEFAVLAEDFDEAQHLSLLASRLIQALDEPIRINSQCHHPGVSIGISLFPDHGLDVTSLLGSADKAMYSAKQQGRNRFLHCEADGPHTSI